MAKGRFDSVGEIPRLGRDLAKETAEVPALTKRSQSRPPQPRALTSRYLAELKGLSELSQDRLKALASRMIVRRFASRSVIYRWDPSKEGMLYIILSGIAKLSSLSGKGEWILMEVVGPGDVLGIPALLPEIRHNLRCEAASECQVGVISPKDLVESIVGLPFQSFTAALKLTVGRWWRLLVRHSNFMDQSLEQRIVVALLDLAAKFGVPDDRGMILNVKLTHRDIAELAGGSRQNVTMYLRKLAAEGALIQERRRIIVRPRKLQAILRPE